MSQPDYLISTPENVDLHLELAGIGNRVYAYVVDSLLSVALMLLVGLACFFIAAVMGPALKNSSLGAWVMFSIFGLTILAEFAIYFGYFIYFEGTWQGQSPGKRLAQIRVIEQNGQPVGWPAVFIRNLVRVVDVGMAVIGVLVMVIDRHERRLGDFAAGTLVIRERLSAKPGGIDLSMVPSTKMLDAGRLSPREYDLLCSFLERRDQLAPSQRPLLARNLESYFRQKLQEPSAGESSEFFLEQLYVAYQARSVS
jgi:uncharacterized RDD family membrane protein YckC